MTPRSASMNPDVRHRLKYSEDSINSFLWTMNSFGSGPTQIRMFSLPRLLWLKSVSVSRSGRMQTYSAMDGSVASTTSLSDSSPCVVCAGFAAFVAIITLAPNIAANAILHAGCVAVASWLCMGEDGMNIPERKIVTGVYKRLASLFTWQSNTEPSPL